PPPSPSTLSLHVALPICFPEQAHRTFVLAQPKISGLQEELHAIAQLVRQRDLCDRRLDGDLLLRPVERRDGLFDHALLVRPCERSEEHTSELQSRENLVC